MNGGLKIGAWFLSQREKLQISKVGRLKYKPCGVRLELDTPV